MVLSLIQFDLMITIANARSVCHRENSQGVFPSSSSSSTPSGTASSTSSRTAFGTSSGTSSNTKNVGELVVVISAAYVGRINYMGFVHPRGLHLLSS
jgi:hypothetical protein